MRKAVSVPTCIYHTQDCLPSHLNMGSFWKTVSCEQPCHMLSWFLLRLSNSPAFFAEGIFRKALTCLCPHNDCQCSCFPLVESLITALTTFADIPSAGSSPWVDVRSLVWLIYHLFNFHQFPCVPAPVPVGYCYICRFTRDWWQFQTNK